MCYPIHFRAEPSLLKKEEKMRKLSVLCAGVFLAAGCGRRAQNTVPVANPGGPYVGFAGESVVVDGSASHDADGDELAYLWSFGDGTSTATGETVFHTYGNPGTYSVCLTVNDGKACSAPACTQASVLDESLPNFPPIANAGSDQTVDSDNASSLDGSGSFDMDGTIVSYEWDFGDGTSGEGAIVSHAYQEFGTYTATLTVTDDKGAEGTDTAQIVVVDEDAELTIKKVVVKDTEPERPYHIGVEVVNTGKVPVVNALFRPSIQDSCQGHHLDWGLRDQYVSFEVGEEKDVVWNGKVPADAALGEYLATIDIFYSGKVLSTSSSFTVGN